MSKRAQVRSRFQRREGRARALEGRLRHVAGQEGPFAHHVGGVVEQSVDALEPEVRHPDEIEIGVDHRHPEGSGVLLRPKGDLGAAQVARVVGGCGHWLATQQFSGKDAIARGVSSGRRSRAASRTWS